MTKNIYIRNDLKNNVHKFFKKKYLLRAHFLAHLFVLGLRDTISHRIRIHQALALNFGFQKVFLVPIFDTNLSCTYRTFIPVPQMYLLKVPSPTSKCKYM